MKKLMLFLVIAIPILVILIVKLTATVTVGEVFISVESIELNKKSVTALVGEELDLSYVIYPEIATNKEVIWQSDNEEVATVNSEGHVDFIGIGSGHISATTQDGNMRSQCDFYVYDTKVHKVELSAPQNFVHIGENLQLNANILPFEALNKEVEFSSSDEDIATVDSNGLVHGIKEGYVEITATSEDGHFSDSIDIAVCYPVTALKVNLTQIISSTNNIHLEYIVEPLDATNKKVNFSVDKPQLAMVNHLGVVTFLSQGEVNITLTTEDGGFSQTINVIYTDGYAYELLLDDFTIDMNIDDIPYFIEYKTSPEILTKTEVSFDSDDKDIAYVDASGYLHAVKGGNTVIRLKVNKSEFETIEKQIYVHIERPAENIELEDVYTAQSKVKLTPKSLPEDSTNTLYFYHVDDESKVTVSLDGEVEFLTTEPCTVSVTVYANVDNSEVFKKINVTYTAGKPASFSLTEKQKTLIYGERYYLNYIIVPEELEVDQLKMTLLSSQSLVSDVVEICDDGSILAVGGGKATIEVSAQLYDGRVVKEILEIVVLRDPEEININVDLEKFEDRYITSLNVVPFSAEVLPLDSKEVEILWSINDKNIAFINEGNLIFNQVGSVILTATVEGISNSIEIFYTGSSPIYAEVRARVENEIIPIPTNLVVGDSFEVLIKNIVPKEIKDPTILIQAKNQKTLNPSGNVFEIDGNVVTAVAGGSATIVVLISNSLRFNFEIDVERKPESLSVLQAKTKVTSSTVILYSEVSPYDTTNKKVIYTVKNEDVAFVEGNVLTFIKNGVAYINAKCEGDENIFIDFYIEKIDTDIVYISPNEKDVVLNKGETLAFNLDEDYSLEILQSEPIISGETVAEINGRYLKACSAGKVKIKIISSVVYEMEILIKQPVENILLTTELDIYQDEYVTGSRTLNLQFEVLPKIAEDKDYTLSIVGSISVDGDREKIAFLSDKTIYFIKAGSVTLKVESVDKNFSTLIKLRYTGGDAIDGFLNVGEKIFLEINQSVEIRVTKWLPFDTTNTFLALYEVNSSGKKMLKINSKTNTLTALDNGVTTLVAELSNGIVKTIEVVALNPVVDIVVEENVLTANDTYTIEAKVLPADATNGNLEFKLQQTDLATITDNVLHFKKAGTVFVEIKTTDGTNLNKLVKVTSTMGQLTTIDLNYESKQIYKKEIVWLKAFKTPYDATQIVSFKILSQTTSDGTDNQVISLSSDGKIVGLYGGVAVVRAFALNKESKEIFADCQITVGVPLENLNVEFLEPLEQYQNQNTFITSKSEIEFKVSYSPDDSTNRNYEFEISNPALASVEQNKIKFSQNGRVTITFKSEGISKTFNFYYVGDDLIEATLDKSQITSGIITLNAGENFKFNLLRKLPSDNLNVQFSIKNVVENRNDPNKPVANFSDGTLFGLNGGVYTFTLYANNLKIENLTLIVKRDATDITIEDGEEIYTSEPTYSIVANVNPSDSSQKYLGFMSLNQDVASVDAEGQVTFNKIGICLIKVYVIEKPDISKTIKIEYTKSIKTLKFNQTRENAYIGESIDISVYAVPMEKIEYEMTIDNKQVADLIKRDDGYRLIGKARGSVTVTAKVLGMDISATKVFNFYERLNHINLELDNSDDLSGQGGYRVFGNNFYNSLNVLTNTYQMNVTLTPNQADKNLLEWISSDLTVATVDETGLVTFVGTGRVTITARQKVLYDGAKVESDSYDFIIVDGINIENPDQFKLAHSTLTEANKDRVDSLRALVLQKNIQISQDFREVYINYNIYGNGHILDDSNFVTDWVRFYLSRSNVVIDNVILRGTAFTQGEQLKNSGNTLMIENCSNVLLYNSRFENADVGIRILASQVVMKGCIVQNCLSVGVRVARTETAVTDLTIEDSIFTSSFCGVLIIMDNLSNPQENIIRLVGEVRFYNWSKLDQIETAIDLKKILSKVGLTFVSGEIIKQVKAIAAKNPSYAYNYNGENYYNFGIFTLRGSVFGMTYAGEYRLDRKDLNSNCNYTSISFTEPMNLGVVIPLTVSALTLSASNPFIRPQDSYIGNSQLLAQIKQPCLF